MSKTNKQARLCLNVWKVRAMNGKYSKYNRNVQMFGFGLNKACFQFSFALFHLGLTFRIHS